MNLDMTLREFFELSARVGDAARVIREAQAMMGGARPVNHDGSPQWSDVMGLPSPLPAEEMDRRMAYAYAHRVPAPIGGPPVGPGPVVLPNGVLMTNKGPVTLTPEEQAQKDRLRMEREARELEVMPDNIKALMVAK